MATMLLLMLAIPAMAQHGSQDDTVTKTFKLTLNGDVPSEQSFSVNYNLDDDPFGEGFFAFCGPPGPSGDPNIEPCEGDGTVYSRSVELERGTTIVFNYLYSPGGDEPDQPFKVGTETLDVDRTNTAEYTFGTGMGDDKKDDDMVPGAGDDKQVSDNQQTGGKGIVTKTFKLTLNGPVPDDRAFGVAFGTLGRLQRDELTEVIFCGQPEAQISGRNGDVSDEDCVGGGETYTYGVNFPKGTSLYFTFITAVEGGEELTAEHFFGNITLAGPGEADVLNADTVNTAWYTFGKDTGAGDDQQGEMPQELPDTGAGGLATGATILTVNAAVGLAMLAGAGYAVARRR